MIPDNYGGFARVEYLAILPAIIYGFIVAEFFMGWGWALRSRKHIRFDFIHLAWTVLAFFLAINMWWGSWTNHAYIDRNIFYYYYSLVLPLVLFLIVVFLFPRGNTSDEVDLVAYFEKQAPFICVLFGLLFSVQVLDAVVFYESAHVKLKSAIKTGAAVLAFTGYFIRTKNFRRVLTAFFTLGLAGFTLVL